MDTHPDTQCPNRFFVIEMRFNGGSPYNYLYCEECQMSYHKTIEPYPYYKLWPEVETKPDLYTVGVSA